VQKLKNYFDLYSDPKDLSHPFRKKAWERLVHLGLPRLKREAFHYLSFKDFYFPKPVTRSESDLTPSPFTCLFVDGFFQKASLPKPLVCMKISDAMRVYGVFLQNRFHSSLMTELDPFVAMNGAFQGEGAFLYVPPDTHLEETIEIFQQVTSSEMTSPRFQIFLGKNSSIRVVQNNKSITSTPFCNIHIDVNLDEGSSLFLGDVQKWPASAQNFTSFHCTLKRSSRVHFLSSSHGARFSRSSISIKLLEENSEALLQGLWQLDDRLEHHTNVLVDHSAPHCRSRQHFKGLLRGESRSSFEGKVFVRPEAQKTEAYQLNNNLLLSHGATALAKPNLEIFADDVKASHGATISQFNEEDLFYLRSRGLFLEQGEALLASGFCDEILNAAPIKL